MDRSLGFRSRFIIDARSHSRRPNGNSLSISHDERPEVEI